MMNRRVNKQRLIFRYMLYLLAAVVLLAVAVVGVRQSRYYFERQKWEKILAEINPACKPYVEWEKGKPIRIFFADPLANFYLTDSDLAVVGKIPSLRNVYITYAPNITGEGIENLRDLKNLLSLTLYCTRLTGEDLKFLRNFPELRCLYLNGSKSITDKGLEYVLGVPELRILVLAGTGITDAGLPVLAKLPSINLLWFGAVDSDLTLEALKNLRDELPGCNVTAQGVCTYDLDLGKPSNATDLTFEDLKIYRKEPDGKLRILVSEIKEPGLGALMIAVVKKEQLSRFGLQMKDIQVAGSQLLDAVVTRYQTQASRFHLRLLRCFWKECFRRNPMRKKRAILANS